MKCELRYLGMGQITGIATCFCVSQNVMSIADIVFVGNAVADSLEIVTDYFVNLFCTVRANNFRKNNSPIDIITVKYIKEIQTPVNV